MSQLMDRAWSADYGEDGYFRYEPGILERQFENEEGSVWLGAYSKGKLVGVNVSFPRKINILGTISETAIPTYLSVLPEYRRKNIASILVREIVKRNQRVGIKKILPYFDDEGMGSSVYKKCYPRMFPLHSGSWLGKIIDPDSFSERVGYDIPARKLVGKKMKMGFLSNKKGGITALINRALENVSAIPSSYPNDAVLGPSDVSRILYLSVPCFKWDRIWSHDELRRELGDPDSFTVGRILNGKLLTVMHFKVRTLVTRKSVKVAWFDWLYGEEGIKKNLLTAIAVAKESGVVLSLVPKMGYFSTIPFLKAGFIPFPKRFGLHCICLDETLLAPVKKIRLDVR